MFHKYRVNDSILNMFVLRTQNLAKKFEHISFPQVLRNLNRQANNQVNITTSLEQEILIKNGGRNPIPPPYPFKSSLE